MKPTSFLPPLFVIISCIQLNTAYSQAGILDNTFGTGGLVSTAITGSEDFGHAIAIQSDDKIIIVGQSYAATGSDISLVRYDADGNLDNTFDGDGIVTTTLAHFSLANAIAIQSDGKIIIAGTTTNVIDLDMIVIRYNSDGSIDNTFATGGFAFLDFDYNDEANALCIQPDGKILVAGTTSEDGVFSNISVARLNTNGTIDASFGTGGTINQDIAGFDDFGYAIAVQPDNKILVGGYTFNGYYDDFAILRYNSNGTLDNAFGGTGIMSYEFNGFNDYCTGIAVTSDNKIIASGTSFTNDYESSFAVMQCNADGSLDDTFGTDGKVTTDFAEGIDFGEGLAIQDNGKILVSGMVENDFDFNIGLVRYTANGILDNTFNTTGIVQTDFTTFEDAGRGVALQSDGKIVVGGYTTDALEYYFAAARYIGDSQNNISENNEDHYLTAYPKPCNNSISINTTTVRGMVTICDITGREIIRQSCLGNTNSINTSDLSPGIYELKYVAGENSASVKFVKQ